MLKPKWIFLENCSSYIRIRRARNLSPAHYIIRKSMEEVFRLWFLRFPARFYPLECLQVNDPRYPENTKPSARYPRTKRSRRQKNIENPIITPLHPDGS